VQKLNIRLHSRYCHIQNTAKNNGVKTKTHSL